MFRLSRKGRSKVTLALSLAVCAALLFALMYGYGIPRDDILAYFWQLLGVVVFFIVLALVPASLLIWFRRKRRHSDPFDLTNQDPTNRNRDR